MNRYPADEADEGDHEVAPDELQSTSPRDDALQSFDPFEDVFGGPAFSYPQEQAFPAHTFNDSRLEDAWTDNARGRSLSIFLQSSDPCEDPLWWNENMLPYSVAAEESNTTNMRGDVQATAIQSPLDQLQGGAEVSSVLRPDDDNELSAGDLEKKSLRAENAEGRSRVPSEDNEEHPAQPKLTSREDTATTEEQPGDCELGVLPVSRLASTGRREDVPSPPPSETKVVENFAADTSRAVSATQPKSPSLETPFTTVPKRRRWSRSSDRETRRKRLKGSAASIPSMSNETRLPLRGQHLSPQALHQLPQEHSQYHGQIDGYFPPQPRDRSCPSDSHDGEEPTPESAYPDPSLYALAPDQGPVDQPHAGFQPTLVNNHSRSIRTDLRRQRGQFLDAKDGGSGHHQCPTARRQLQANPGVETNVDKGKFEWPGQEPPDLTNLSTWPPPYPDMDRPGPGGPGTWPCDWIELESHRTQMKYPRFPRGTDKIPGRHPLQTYCYWFPNHVRDAGLDLFRAAGWSGRKIWDHYHPNAVEVCRARAEKGDGKLADRPWNFLQQWLSRRKREVEKAADPSSLQDAASQSHDSSSDDSSRQVRCRPGHLQLSVGPSTPSRSKTKKASGQASQFHPEFSLGHDAGYLLTSRNIGLAPPVTEGNRPALSGSRHSQSTASEPWWRGQLMTQIERVRQLLRETNPVFDQQTHRTQILEADLHLRRQFPMFARRVWLQVLQGLIVPQNNLHPMNALRNIHGQLRRNDPHMQLPDEQRFCDGMMERYLRDISNFLTNEEHRLQEPPAVSLATSKHVNIGAFQHPRGSLHDFHPADSTNVQAGTLLLQQPISHHEVGQTQHDTNSAAIERGLVHASSASSVGNSEFPGLTAQSYPFNQPGLLTRASAQPMSRASLRDTGAERHRQQTDPEEGVPS